MTANEAAKKLADNTWGLLLARFVTPGLLTIALWLGSQYLARLDEAIDVMTSRLDRQDDSLAAINRQIAAIEASRLEASKFGDGNLEQLKNDVQGLRTRVDIAVTQIAAVGAKVEVLLSQTRSSADP